ncbi:MAG: aminotransferase class IV [Planctomycetota bacterium]|jgi:branched-chain amino acid aminotransferase|nr:aminotransferase class IV [Planctomycetota bacterium]
MPDMALVNGQLTTLAEATVSVCDLGFLRGIGAFETLRSYAGHPHALSEHLRRLGAAAEALGIPPVLTEVEFRPQLAAAVQATGYSDVRVNLIVTPGLHTDGVFGADQPTVVVLLRELHEPPAAWYTDGVGAVTFRGARVCPQFKTTAYITGREGLLAAERAGAHEAIYCDEQGLIAEGVTSNVLILKDGAVLSPRISNLPGITRAGLQPLARAAGLEWQQADLTRDTCFEADEMWISSAVRELVPIVTLDGHSIGSGHPGPWASRLRAAYRAAAEADAARDAESS